MYVRLTLIMVYAKSVWRYWLKRTLAIFFHSVHCFVRLTVRKFNNICIRVHALEIIDSVCKADFGNGVHKVSMAILAIHILGNFFKFSHRMIGQHLCTWDGGNNVTSACRLDASRCHCHEQRMHAGGDEQRRDTGARPARNRDGCAVKSTME